MEDKKGAEQLYIHAERNQDIVVEVDETHSVGNNRVKSIGMNETVTIGNNRLRAVKLDDVLLVGSTKTDSISQSYLIEVGQNLRLVCGKSILELNASGQINLSGVAINFHASGDAEFNTGGVLNLNIGGGPGATPAGQGDQAASMQPSNPCSGKTKEASDELHHSRTEPAIARQGPAGQQHQHPAPQ